MASDHRDLFEGRWVLNEKESDSLDALLKAQGVGWAKRKVASHLSVTQVFTYIGENEISLEAETSVKTRENHAKIDGIRKKTHHDQYGDIEVYFAWENKDGKVHLVMEMEADHDGVGKGLTRIDRYVEGNKMIQVMNFKTLDGKENVQNVKRIFYKQ